MQRAFRHLVDLYPAAYRSEFGDEILEVLRQVAQDAHDRGLLAYVWLCARESQALLTSAAKEWILLWMGDYPWAQIATRRFRMRSEFRYPKATVPIMALILAAIILIIRKAGSVQTTPEPLDSLMSSIPVFGLALLVACAAGALGWLVLHWMHKSGLHRLSEAHTWPQGK